MEKQLKQYAYRENIEPLTELVELLQSDLHDMSALEASAYLKRAELLLESMRVELRAEANADFDQLKATDAKQKRFPINSFATCEHYPLRTVWEYPAEIVAAESNLKADKALARKNGTAVDKTEPFDPKTMAGFSILIIEATT